MKEEARLMYVAITRARDYIIFPTNAYPTKWLNRVWHKGREDFPALDAENKETLWEWNGHYLEIDNSIFEMPRIFDPESNEGNRKSPEYFETGRGKAEILPFKFDPNELPVNGSIGAVYHYHSPLMMEDFEVKTQLGKVLNAYFQATLNTTNNEKLPEIEEQLLVNFELSDFREKLGLTQRANAFFTLLKREFIPEEIICGYPIDHFVDYRLLTAELDYLIVNQEETIIIYHDYLYGQEHQLKKRSRALSGELALYKKAVRSLRGVDSIRIFVHFIVDGVMIEVLV